MMNLAKLLSRWIRIPHSARSSLVVHTYSVMDVVLGVLFTVIFISQIFNLGTAPDFGIYEFSWILHSLSRSILPLVGGSLGLMGRQKRSYSHVEMYLKLKISQIVCAVSHIAIVQTYFHWILSKLTDETIQSMIDEARAAGLPDPEIDRRAIWDELKPGLLTERNSSVYIVAACLVGIYYLWSLASWYRAGIDPDEPQVIVSIPMSSLDSSVSGQQQVTPLLQGQQPTIPVSVV